jgi:putative hydrolase of the HAD superfamily
VSPVPELPRRLSAVFLDAGGTLLRERASRASLYAAAAREAGLDVGEAQMRDLMYRTHAELDRSEGGHFRYTRGWFELYIARVFCRGLGLAPAGLPGVVEALFARFGDPATFRLLPGARELVEGLRGRGLKVGVISNWSEALPGLLAGLGLTPHLDCVVVSALEGCEKPEPRIFELALARAGVPAAEALHAGDDPLKDVQGARAAGILPVLVGPATPPAAAGCARVPDLFALERMILEALP